MEVSFEFRCNSCLSLVERSTCSRCVPEATACSDGRRPSVVLHDGDLRAAHHFLPTGGSSSPALFNFLLLVVVAYAEKIHSRIRFIK